MTVKELIEKLNKCDADTVVFVTGTNDSKNIYEACEVFAAERIDEYDGKNKFVCIDHSNEPDYDIN